MPDGSPLKIRTMADDLKRAEKGEVNFTPYVSDTSAPLKIEKKFSSHIVKPPEFKEEEKKSLKDVLIQLAENGDDLELSGANKNEETNEETEKKDKSKLKDLLSKMENLSRKHPTSSAAPSSPSSSLPDHFVLTPSHSFQKGSEIETQKEIKKEEIKGKSEIKESQFHKLPKEEKSLPERRSRKIENIKEMKEEMSLLRDQKITREEILRIEKELEEKKEKLEEIKKRKKAKEEGVLEESGVITSTEREKKLRTGEEALREIEEKAAKEAETEAKADFETSYLSPEARLLYNKAEHHSSVLNKVKEKRKTPEVSKIEKILKDQKPPEKEKKKDPDREYRRFKKSLKSKYQARLAEKMSRRMIIALVVIMLIGIASVFSWFLVFKKSPKNPPLHPSPKVAKVEGIKEFSSIKDEIVINLEKDESGIGLISKINARAARLKREKRLANISRIIVKKEGVPISLRELLDELKIKIPSDTLDFFDNNRYNLILFEEATGAKRLGLAMVTSNPSTTRLKFQSWENENIASRKIYRAFEPLFMGSRISSVSQERFKTGKYMGVKMRYLQIPDKNTSLDYLVYGDILVITTSKDSIFQVIEILISS